jgi:hypothetical protein
MVASSRDKTKSVLETFFGKPVAKPTTFGRFFDSNREEANLQSIDVV